MSATSATVFEGRVTKVETVDIGGRDTGYRVAARDKAGFDELGWEIEFWSESAPRVGEPVEVTVKVGSDV